MEISNRQHAYFQLARRASYNSGLRYRVGSVLVHSGRVLNTACNASRPSSLTRYDPYWSLHGEIAACLGFDIEVLSGAIVYNWRETRDGQPACSKPCDLCQDKLSSLGIAKVYYSDKDSYGMVKL